jgi:alpha-amylase/alpha-mannosidase (GH57 family)
MLKVFPADLMMGSLRVVFLWHQHQPFYKDLVTGEYRLPWVRMHALKDYYGMVKLLDEFPHVHQTFNLVPSLITQIEDYVNGSARDAFFDVAAKPAADLSPGERRFATEYLFQANPVHLIGRYPRYRQLWEHGRAMGKRAAELFQTQDFTDLQVLSQLVWFDEFFLEDPDVAALVRKQKSFSLEDQKFVVAKQRELIAAVIPAHKDAAQKGRIEISTSPFYHPILPLLCDSEQGAVSTPGLPLPRSRFRHPEDAREQLARALKLHQCVFGTKPRGVWPSEGSVSEQVLGIAHELGVEWMATDEGVLGRTIGYGFQRRESRLSSDGAHKLYTLYRYEKDGARMHLLFRDHTLSDLIGFVYSGISAQDASRHFVRSIKESAQPLLEQGKDAVVSIILDGENAWEYYPRSGREFLRRLYDSLQSDPQIEALTVSEAIDRQRHFPLLHSLVPGSWIHANFNVWIGASEDNRAWEFLAEARDLYSQMEVKVSPQQRQLAYEELLIAEGSDWNWWYGPEHHSANERDFDELYRKHLSNVYQALGATPPEYLAQPISEGVVRANFVPQTAYIRPHVDGGSGRYFDWIGAAMYTADQRTSAMHGKQFLLDAIYAGVDEQNLYGRLEFLASIAADDFEIVLNCETWAAGASSPRATVRLNAAVVDGTLRSAQLHTGSDNPSPLQLSDDPTGVLIRLKTNFEIRMPFDILRTERGDTLKLRFSVWRGGLPIDALPVGGWFELQVLPEEQLAAHAY